MKILLVDDSKTMRSIQRGILTQLGFAQIQEASDGADALARVDNIRPDLILVDWNMPNMNGPAFVRAYRERGGQAAVVMVSAECERPRVVEAVKTGVDNFVAKPFTPDLLAQRIGETVSSRQAVAAAA